MGLIHLEEANVSYEGQTLPAIHLISRLQTQLRESACRIATIAETLGDLQTALLNSHTVEVKLTLSQEDYGRFKSMEGMDDSERIRKAIMTVIHPREAGIPREAGESKPSTSITDSNLAQSPVESAPVIAKSADPIRPPAPEPQDVKKTFTEQPVALEPAIKKRSTAKCSTCRSSIDLPETINDEWPVELKCGTCGTKCIMPPLPRKHWTNYMTVVPPQEADIHRDAHASRPAPSPIEAESAPAITKSADPVRSHVTAPQALEKSSPGQPVTLESATNKKSATKCPICQSLFARLPGIPVSYDPAI